MNSSLKGKIALVLGASGGIGEAITKKLHNQGMSVAISARTESKLTALAKSLGNERVFVFPADGSKIEDITKLFNEVRERYNQIDLVIISSGGWKPLALSSSPQEASEVLDQMIGGNITAPFNVGYVAGQIMAEQGSGHIINISSHAGVRILPANLAYGPTKAAARWFFLSLERELRDAGVKVTDLQPATVNTPAMSGMLEEEKKHLAVQPEDIAEIIVNLATAPPHTHVIEMKIDGDYTF